MHPPFAGQTERPTAEECCAIFELRQYTLKDGQRDVLIELFDREFVETQETIGMRIYGQFRDVDRPNYFVWIRAFPDMEVRHRALTSFYSGPVWKAHGKQAALTMIDSDDVLLLRPVDPPGGFNDVPAMRAAPGAAPPSSLVIATIYSVRPGAAQDFPEFFRSRVLRVTSVQGVVTLSRSWSLVLGEFERRLRSLMQAVNCLDQD